MKKKKTPLISSKAEKSQKLHSFFQEWLNNYKSLWSLVIIFVKFANL